MAADADRPPASPPSDKWCTMYEMKRYPASTARERMADVLDEVERAGSAVIERGDVQYVITVKRAAVKRPRRAPLVEIVDPAVAAGEWRWEMSKAGLRFKGSPTPAAPRRRRSR